MAKTKQTDSTPVTITFTPEEVATIMALREGTVGLSTPSGPSAAQNELAQAFITAIEATKPVAKKNSLNRKRSGPFEAKDGKPKPKLRRRMMHHSQELHEDTLLPQEIELLNKIKPGSYCNHTIKVVKRKDRALDIDYPIKTASQRLKLINTYKITSFSSLLERLIQESLDPVKYKNPEGDEDDD